LNAVATPIAERDGDHELSNRVVHGPQIFDSIAGSDCGILAL